MSTPVTAQITPNNRTKVGNGARLFPRPKFGGPDMRTREGRRIAELHADYSGDFVAKHGRQPTASERLRIKSAASLSFRCEEMSSALASGARLDAEHVTALCSEERRTLVLLGLVGDEPAPAEPLSLEALLSIR